MRFHQLVASGHRARLDGSGKIYSRRIFRTKLEMEAYEEEFREIVVMPKNDFDLMVLSDDPSLQIGIVELEAKEIA